MGTRLGLVLSRRLANLLGGDVTLTQTEVHHGSTFTVTVDPGPLHETSRVSATRADDPLTLSPPARLDGVRVLVADDSQDNQLLLSRILEMAGATVEVVSNGREAVREIHRAGQFDMVLWICKCP